MAALRALQQPRLLQARARLNEAAKLYIAAVRGNQHEQFNPEALGFEFTIEQIEMRALDFEPDLFHDWAAEQERGRNAVE